MVNEIILLYPFDKANSGWNWTTSDTIAVATAVIAFLALIVSFYTLKANQRKIILDNQSKNSLFYLNQIKTYLENAIALLADGNNNNIKWHRAVASLEIADDLKSELKDKPHQHIYLQDYIHTAYRIIDITKDIDDFMFYYGIADYKEKTSKVLFSEANANPFGCSCYNINPKKLIILWDFIDKAIRCNNALSKKSTPWEEIYNSAYFKVNIDEAKALAGFTEKAAKAVDDYIRDYRIHCTQVNKEF